MNKLIFDGTPLTIEDIVDVSNRSVAAKISEEEHYKQKINKGFQYIAEMLQDGKQVYGVNTGYGESCDESIPKELVDLLPQNLYRFLGCGMGKHFTKEQTRAILATRLQSLSLGKSGVRWSLLKSIQALLEEDILPLIPSEGSVGASGDLVPLSYVAAVLCGERNVIYKGEIMPSKVALNIAKRQAIELKPKEGLAIVNGTAVMTGLACLAYDKAAYLAKLSTRITSLSILALKGNSNHYDEALFAVKPHKGQQEVASWIRKDLSNYKCEDGNLQDRYSLRCAPHIIGVLQDSLPWLRQFIECELNSVNDNPVIDPENTRLLHGGHFYGGHIAFAMDALKVALSNIADLHDRQLALLVDSKFNNGLPSNLSAKNDLFAVHHGLKGVQIAASSWTAEALKQSTPASIFSRSTECHNQDKVSLGTIAARDCLRVMELLEQVMAAMLIAVNQAMEIRLRSNETAVSMLTNQVKKMLSDLQQLSPFIERDREVEAELNSIVCKIREKHFDVYPT